MASPRSFVWTRWIFLAVLTVFVLVPVYVMISSSLKPLQDVSGEFRWIPSGLTVRPYFDIWETVPLAKYFVNSLIVAGAAAVFSVIVAVFAAYGVSRYRFRGKRVFTVTVLSTQMFPGILFLLPLFLIYVNIGNATGIALFGSRGGLILTYLTFSLPFSIWMLIGYFESVPRELDEAATVDGCGPLGALFRVVVPAATPGIVAVGVYSFMTAWGEVLFASVMTNDTTRTLSIGLQSYATQNDVYWNQVMAASLVVSVPVVAGFLLLQRYLVAGLTAGSVK
ncbi:MULTISPECIES: carbohydrate ABC transporter permease [Streptomyces]|uniref:Carbohydrate ABC transporter permease n=1 Tax=Streptomyces odorifer TaxID=53450 RepID=A0A7Y6C969_9ACTN|nr:MULTISPECIES: carbohydrate ABC transporter permease [Streptomyces]NUV34068.1 carbohydrate ABC transporter permease [Streptomyces sp. KAI-27]NUV46312.1 carbohydrate ABC transporter permease [Streptomyces sp. CAI-78]MBL0778025.1 carbohydrate ABC transporter permease [Streptomyces albidoflavus]MCG5117261.1 carbohydrate ABC transporter permease [Streptomyces sp. T7(2022)]MCR0987978.1 carbohydrate ABC transporter permease [Streptomyces albidoflavus]